MLLMAEGLLCSLAFAGAAHERVRLVGLSKPFQVWKSFPLRDIPGLT